METQPAKLEGFLAIQTLAVLSFVVLIGIGVWRVHQVFAKGNTVSAVNATRALPGHASTLYESVNWQTSASDGTTSDQTSDPDGISNIGANVAQTIYDTYTSLRESGTYTPEEGEKIAQDIATSLHANISYKTFLPSDIKTDRDTSFERMMKYRQDLRVALEPLLKNPGYELSLFVNYIDSHDAMYLRKLSTTVKNYTAAIENASDLVVPEDALSYHLGILNSLSEFKTTIERMAEHADDAIAAAALLRPYNESEARMMSSFNTLAQYYKSKLP